MRSEKRVRITIELPNSFLRLLAAKASFKGWSKWIEDGEDEPQMDAAGIVAFLVYMEARGAHEALVHARTPLMWRTGGPEIIHEERRVIEAEEQPA